MIRARARVGWIIQSTYSDMSRATVVWLLWGLQGRFGPRMYRSSIHRGIVLGDPSDCPCRRLSEKAVSVADHAEFGLSGSGRLHSCGCFRIFRVQ